MSWCFVLLSSCLVSFCPCSFWQKGCVPTSRRIPGKEIIAGWHPDRPSQKTQAWVWGQGGPINHLVNPCSSFSAQRAALLNIYAYGLSMTYQVVSAMICRRSPSARVAARFYGVIKRTALFWVLSNKPYCGYTLLSAAPSAGKRFCTETAPTYDKSLCSF